MTNLTLNIISIYIFLSIVLQLSWQIKVSFLSETVPDYSKLTLTQAKRLEMEAQVRMAYVFITHCYIFFEKGLKLPLTPFFLFKFTEFRLYNCKNFHMPLNN